MIKDFEQLQYMEPDFREDVWNMLLDHPEFQNCCRYTLNEVKRYSDHLRNLSWRTNNAAPEFMARFNSTESAIIHFFAGSTTRASKVEAWELRLKSAVQKCQRLLRDIIAYCEKTQTLRAELEAHKSKRLKGLPLEKTDNNS